MQKVGSVVHFAVSVDGSSFDFQAVNFLPNCAPKKELLHLDTAIELF